MSTKNYFISNENHHFFYLSSANLAINTNLEYYLQKREEFEYKYIEADVLTIKCLDTIEALDCFNSKGEFIFKPNPINHELRKIKYDDKFIDLDEMKKNGQLGKTEQATPFDDLNKEEKEEQRKQMLKQMEIKERMRLKHENAKKNKKQKKIRLNEIRNFKIYFDFSGNWIKNCEKKRTKSAKIEKKLNYILYLECQLNQNLTYYPLKDLKNLIKTSKNRYEQFDQRTLRYAKKSKVK